MKACANSVVKEDVDEQVWLFRFFCEFTGDMVEEFYKKNPTLPQCFCVFARNISDAQRRAEEIKEEIISKEGISFAKKIEVRITPCCSRKESELDRDSW